MTTKNTRSSVLSFDTFPYKNSEYTISTAETNVSDKLCFE